MTKNKLYTLLAIACFFGFLWIGFTVFVDSKIGGLPFKTCLFKNMTSYPCPSCGTTRSVKMLIFDGNLKGALMMNPMGIIVAFIMIVMPVWLAFDLIFKRQTLFDAYIRIEKTVATRRVAILLIVLVILNWIWNLNKHL